MAGCTLGAAVEFWKPEQMKAWAEYIGDQFPPVDYWSMIKDPILWIWALLRFRFGPLFEEQGARK